MKKWPYSLEIKVRFRDIDAKQHVNNSVVITYLEQARTEYFSKLSGTNTIEDIDFILAFIKCSYKGAISISDKPVVYVRPSRIGNTSWNFEYEIRDKETDKLFADAETVQVLYDYKKKKKKKITGEFKKKLLEEIYEEAAYFM